MALTKSFQGKLLISATDGKKLGEVKDVFLDETAGKIVAVYLGKSGLINRKSLLIEIDHVALFGIDCWMINGSDKVIAKDDGENRDTYILADDLRGREVQTDGGTKIGVIGDVIVDNACQVLGFSLDKLHVEGPLSQSKAIARPAITSLGDKDNTMIASLTEAEKLSISAS